MTSPAHREWPTKGRERSNVAVLAAALASAGPAGRGGAFAMRRWQTPSRSAPAANASQKIARHPRPALTIAPATGATMMPTAMLALR